MRCGLFGKVPAKRDFIAINAPRGFLEVWEPWMQGGLSASRQELGGAWQEAFLHAPIWRFWLGAGLCGQAIAGAFMPSLDGVGRYYPLTVFACAGEAGAVPPPELDSQDAWFAALEEFLLATLQHDLPFESILAALERLPPPAVQPVDLPPPLARARDGTLAALAPAADFSAVFARLRIADFARLCAGSSFWWTIGGADLAPLAFSAARMPDPFLFAAMLTGRPERVAPTGALVIDDA
jgi:type VI secretion system protein ImpM